MEMASPEGCQMGGLQHGEFFDLYDVAYQLGIPMHEASKVMIYLRSLRHVEK